MPLLVLVIATTRRTFLTLDQLIIVRSLFYYSFVRRFLVYLTTIYQLTYLTPSANVAVNQRSALL
jgi:hypothetical protein